MLRFDITREGGTRLRPRRDSSRRERERALQQPKGLDAEFHIGSRVFGRTIVKGRMRKAKDRELHRLLGLGGQWFCSCASVTDGSPLRSAGMTPPTYLDHQKVRGVRQQLLAVLKEKTAPTGADAA